MGFLNLSTNVSSKKNVDFNDVRYQLSDKLKQSENKNIRATFTLYDSKEYKKTAVQEISAAYALSDKHLPMGELLNKMADLIVDMEDGVLDSEKDAVYAWKYSITLLEIYEDKIRRQETLDSFDNSLKTAVVNSQIFINKYPGKYTLRTNFFNEKLKADLVTDVVETFKETALPGIHETAIKQSRERAEKHHNPTLDKIVEWAITNYKCKVDSYFQIKKDETELFFSINTVIVHLRNGYDMSIVGYVGTDYDDKFAVSILDTQKISIQEHGERISEEEIQNAFAAASENDPIDPLINLLKVERKKNDVLKKQYDILAAIRPMIPAKVLKIQAAESIVGRDYIWGCEKFRETHEDLPEDFKLEDVVLPEYIETEEELREQAKSKDLLSNMEELTDSMKEMQDNQAQSDNEEKHGNTSDGMENTNTAKNTEPPVINVQMGSQKQNEEKPNNVETPINIDNSTASVIKERTAEDILKEMGPIEDLFENTKKEEKLKFGDPRRAEFKTPVLTEQNKATNIANQKKEGGFGTQLKGFDQASTLLPGMIPVAEKKEGPTGPSITGEAKPIPEFETSLWKEASNDTIFEEPVVEKEIKQVQPSLEEPKQKHADTQMMEGIGLDSLEIDNVSVTEETPRTENTEVLENIELEEFNQPGQGKEQGNHEVEEPELILDDLDSLFA